MCFLRNQLLLEVVEIFDNFALIRVLRGYKKPRETRGFLFLHFPEKINLWDLALSPLETWAGNGMKVRVAKHHMPARLQWVPTPSRWVRRFVALRKATPATLGSEW